MLSNADLTLQKIIIYQLHLIPGELKLLKGFDHLLLGDHVSLLLRKVLYFL